MGTVDDTFEDVNANGHTIEASFAINVYTITASAGANGAISPSGAVSVNHGDDQSFTITPDAGYHVLDVLVDGSSVGAVTSYTFDDVTTNHTIEASFAINVYTITASAGAERLDLAERRGAGQPRRRSELHDHAGRRLPRRSTCSSTAAPSAR